MLYLILICFIVVLMVDSDNRIANFMFFILIFVPLYSMSIIVGIGTVIWQDIIKVKLRNMKKLV